MNGELSQYLVLCLTENQRFSTDFRLIPPTTCPNNNTHEIDPNDIQVISTISPNVTKIDQETKIKTGGYYRYHSTNMTISPNSALSYDLFFKYNINVYTVTLKLTSQNIGDTFYSTYRPNTIIRSPLNDVNIGDDKLTLPLEAALSLNPGFSLKLTDNINTEDLGYILSINKETGEITFENPSTRYYTNTSLLSITVYLVDPLTFVNSNDIVLGASKLSNTGLPLGHIIQLTYVNNSEIEKKFQLNIEYSF
jgi:hypothetical protein